MMTIYLMRHGEAVSPSEWDGDDASRPLTSLGKAHIQSALQKLVQLNFSVSRLLVSPLVRAQQTADLIEKALPSLKKVLAPDFTSGSSLAKMKSGIEKYKTDPSIWIVGHMPDLAILGSRITTEASLLENGLKPGEIWAFEADLESGAWGNGRMLWRRTLDQWGKVKSL